MSKKLKKGLIRIIICAVAFIAVKLLEAFTPIADYKYVTLILYLAIYIGISHDIIKKACMNIIRGNMLDENFLMMIASIGAFFVGSYSEGVAVVLFYQTGEWFQSYAVGKSRNSIKELMSIRPDYAVVIRDGVEEEVDPDEVSTGETIIVRPGERIPLDGTVTEGITALDTMALTGESVPKDIVPGDDVISGCVNLSGLIKVNVTKEYSESTVSKILELVENATDKKAESENFISRFARYYTPSVVGAAVLLAVIPSIITGQWLTWIYRALSFLVISCPCALVISIPLSFFGGIGGASREGILVKGSSYLEQLNKAEIIAMDKTGTLTKGVFGVDSVYVESDDISEDALLKVAAIAESYSSHPIAVSLVDTYIKKSGSDRDSLKAAIEDIEEIAGHGIRAGIEGKEYFVGNAKLMKDKGISVSESESSGTIVYVSDGKKLLGHILLSDIVKDDAASAVAGLIKCGVKRIVMLTGDRKATAEAVAGKIGIKEYHSDLLPADKVQIVEDLFADKSENGRLIFVGDGINDAPVLARADIGIAMGGLGSDAAIEAADIVIMTDEPGKIAKAVAISRKTLKIVRENIVFAIGVKLLVLVLAAVGFATMWAAVFADVGVAFIAILNAMRALKTS
ncbi:MAG: heavy metal translocating P-type ATPase [Lachnospiraceae bacterium]|nr:heavy metal translocating P-type ATPase [Lachnospiraceae bacterium]